MSNIAFPNIHVTAFQHPNDIQAIEALRSVKGLDIVCHKMMELGYEKISYINLIANAIRVTNTHFSKLHNILCDASKILSIEPPQLFIEKSDELNAYTYGSENPFIVLNSALVENFSEDEIRVAIGHELGHIKCRHVIYSSVARFIKDFADFLAGPSMGLASFLSMGLEFALFKWERKSELTSDRAALLVTQDIELCLSVFMKFMKFPPGIAKEMVLSEFLSQAELYSELDSDILSKIYKILAVSKKTHPDWVVRAKELSDWAKSESYKKLLEGNYPTGESNVSAISQEDIKKEIVEKSAPVIPADIEATKNAAVNMVKGGFKNLFGK